MAKKIDNDIIVLIEHLKSIDVTISSLLMSHLIKIDNRISEKEKKPQPTKPPMPKPPQPLKNAPTSALNKNTKGEKRREYCKHQLSVINPTFPWGKVYYKCRYHNCEKFEGYA